MKHHRITARALAALLAYPDAALRAAAPDIAQALRGEAALPKSRLAELDALCAQLRSMDPFELEARYVETFDRGRSTALHLFEHVHGDSRERGPAMVDLLQTYERAGLRLDGRELPDHLAVVLEFVSTQPPREARAFLGEVTHIVQKIFSALLERGSPYAAVIGAVLELAGERAERVPVAADEPIDEAWAEPPAFDGCSTRGQARPDAPQPIQIVRKSHAREGVRA